MNAARRGDKPRARASERPLVAAWLCLLREGPYHRPARSEAAGPLKGPGEQSGG